MQCLEWNAERNAVAVPQIDEEHQAIFQMGNDLYQALAGGALLNAVEPGVRRLSATARAGLLERFAQTDQRGVASVRQFRRSCISARMAACRRAPRCPMGDRVVI